MALQAIIGGGTLLIPNEINQLFNGTPSNSDSVPLDALDEALHIVGRLVMQDRGAGGTKTLLTTGGASKIHWASGATSVLNAASVLRVGLQTVDLANGPASRGDGVFDIYKDVAGTLAASTWHNAVLNAGSNQTLTNGDLIAVCFQLTTFTAADNVFFRCGITSNSGLSGGTGYTHILSSGTVFNALSNVPNVMIEFSDGTIGWLAETFPFHTAAGNSFNVGTATADEYGNVVRLPVPFKSDGVQVGAFAPAGDCEIIRYSDPFGTPTVQRSMTVDANAVLASAVRRMPIIWSTPFTGAKNTDYAITVRPTTVTNVSLYYFDAGSALAMTAHPLGQDCYAVRRLNNTGSFSDYNGGTAKTRRHFMSLSISHLDDGVGGGGGSYVG